MAKWTLALKTVAAACVLACPGASAWSQEQINASRRPATAVAGPAVPGKFIVELQAGAQTSQRDIASRATTLLGDMRIKGYEVEIKTDYSMVSGRFQGVSVQIASNKNASINDIKGIPGVADVWPVYAIALDDTIDTTDPSPQWNPHITTRVDELHKRGFTGEGQRVCVVDSGVDATHPALSGRIVGGKNLIEDNDNFEDCMGHGTFVSSVILGSTKDLTGVAPRAEVFMYKVFACENSVSDDLLLKGLLAADADDCDIVSVSIGSETGYSGSILSRMASEISKDRLVIIAAGNSGETGTFYASSPASGRGVISVASTNAKQVLGWPALIVSSSGETFNLSYVTPDGAKLNESVVAPITFDAGDSCNPEQYGSEEQALIVKRGICFPQGSYNELSSTGFGYYLIFDSYNQGVFYVDDVDNYNPSVHLFALTDAFVGEWVKAQIAEQYNLTLEIEVDADTAAFASDRPSAGQVSYFSSWGPSFENDFSPSVAAPGGAVYGAFPDNTYAVGSGTSFSAPYVAGVAALYYAHVKKDHSEFARRLSSTAALLPAYDDTNVEVVGTIAPLIQQGAGLIDAVKVFDYQTVLLSDRQISLNDTDNRVNTHTISLQNAGSEAITYKISHSIAATVQSRDEDLYPYVYYPPLLADVEGSIEAPDSVTIPAGSTQDVIVTFHSPMSSDNSSGVVWSGKVVFQGENDETLAVPYMGVQASTYNWTPLEGSPLVFRYDDVSGYLYPVDWESKPYKPAELSSPEIYFALRYGTYEFSMDLVGEDYTTDDFAYPLTAGPASNQWRGPVRTQPDVYGYYTDFPTKFPIRFSNVGFNTFQSFSNGTEIPSGRYRILSRALRVFGDGSNPQDWQLFLSDPFSIQLNDDPIPGVTSSTISSSTAAPTFTEATSSVQLPTSEPVTTTSAPITSATSVPGITTTLKAFAQPTGLAGAFVDLSLYRQNTEESHDLFDTNSWLEIHVQISIPTRLYEGTTVSFALPQVFVDVAESKYVQSTSVLVGTALFDSETSIFTVTFNDWVTWHDNIVGDFYLSCRLNPDFQTEMMAGTYFVEMETVGKTFLEPLYYRAIDRSRVYESVREVESDDGSQLFAFVVEVPGSVGPWTSVTLISSQSSGDDGFRCELTHVNLGMTFDDSNRIVDSTDVTNQTVRRCEVKEFRAIYSSSIETHEVLQLNIINMMGNKGSGSIAMPYSLAIQLENGTSIGYSSRTITYNLISRTRPDYFFSGDIDRDGPIAGGTATSSITSITMTTSATTSTRFDNSATSSVTSTATWSASSQSANSTSSSSAISIAPSSSSVSHISTSLLSSSSVTLSASSSSIGTSTILLSNSSTSLAPSTQVSTAIGGNSTYSISLTSASAMSSLLFSSSASSPLSSSSTVSVSSLPASSRTSSEALSSSSRLHTGSLSSSTELISSSTGSLSPSITSSSPPKTKSIVNTVTVITTVCTDPLWTAPVTLTITVPCTTEPQAPVTTVTSVCTTCASHPVTLTYAQPVLVNSPTGSGGSGSHGGTAMVTYGSRTVERGSASQIPAEPTIMTIPIIGNGGHSKPQTTATSQSLEASTTTGGRGAEQPGESVGSSPSAASLSVKTSTIPAGSPSKTTPSAPARPTTVVTDAGAFFQVTLGGIVSTIVACLLAVLV